MMANTTDPQSLVEGVLYDMSRGARDEIERFVVCVSPDLDPAVRYQLGETTEFEGIPVILHLSAIMRPSDGAFVMAERPLLSDLGMHT